MTGRAAAAVRSWLGRLGRRGGHTNGTGGAGAWRRTGDALAELLDLAPAERTARLAALDTPDGELRRELDALLDAHASPGLLDENVLDLVSVPPDPATAPAPIGRI